VRGSRLRSDIFLPLSPVGPERGCATNGEREKSESPPLFDRTSGQRLSQTAFSARARRDPLPQDSETTPHDSKALIPARKTEAVSAATIFVCTTCRRKRADVPLGYDLPGEGLVRALEEEVARQGLDEIAVTPVACLAVCNRPCTVAFTGPGKWTHLVGNLHPEAHVKDIVANARMVASVPDGIVPWAERPQAIRSGGIARVPPLGFKSES
jgi:predicted metal-binding protein